MYNVVNGCVAMNAYNISAQIEFKYIFLNKPHPHNIRRTAVHTNIELKDKFFLSIIIITLYTISTLFCITFVNVLFVHCFNGILKSQHVTL